MKNNKSIALLLLASVLRYYNYALFGFSAAILSKKFWPNDNYESQYLGFFFIFSIANLARPVGSIIFGKIGDKLGRVSAIRITLLISSLSTIIIGSLPSFETIGWISLIILTAARMSFMAALSGEVDAIKIFIYEKLTDRKRHFAMGLLSFSSQIGVLFASSFYYLSLIDSQDFYWRLNFILGGVIGIILLFFIDKLKESKNFDDNYIFDDNYDNNLKTIILNNKYKLFLATLANGLLGGGYNFSVIFILNFLTNIAEITEITITGIYLIFTIIIYSISSILAGYFFAKFTNKLAENLFVLLNILTISVSMILASYDKFSLYIHLISIFLLPFYSVPLYVRLPRLFDMSVRMRMYSLSHSVGSLIFSSTTPFLCMLIWNYSKMTNLVFGYYLLQLIILFFTIKSITKIASE